MLPANIGNLLFDDFQNLHGASLDADAAGDALGGGVAFLLDHDLHGADFYALTARNTLLLVDHVNTGLGVLGDRLMLANFHALTALNADIGLCSIALGNDLDAGKIGIKFLIKCFGTSLHALQTSHTFGIFLNSELLHGREISFIIIYRRYYIV